MVDKKFWKLFIIYSLVISVSLMRVDVLLNEKKSNIVNNELSEQYAVYLPNQDNIISRYQTSSQTNRLEELVVDLVTVLKSGVSDSYPLIPETVNVISVYLIDDCIYLSFNERLDDYQIEGLVFSLLELEDVNKVKLFIDSEPMLYKNQLRELTLEIGINHDISSFDMTESNILTIFYVDGDRLVPISYFNQETNLETVFTELENNTSLYSSLLSAIDFTYKTEGRTVIVEINEVYQSNNLLYDQISLSVLMLNEYDNIEIIENGVVVYSK